MEQNSAIERLNSLRTTNCEFKKLKDLAPAVFKVKCVIVYKTPYGMKSSARLLDRDWMIQLPDIFTEEFTRDPTQLRNLNSKPCNMVYEGMVKNRHIVKFEKLIEDGPSMDSQNVDKA